MTMVQRMPWLTPAVAVLAAVIAVLVLGDVILATRLVATHSNPPPVAATHQTATGHPCNHGYYVSQAAHAKKGGGYVSGVAQSDLGKNGNCSAPLPAKAPAAPSRGSDS